MVRSHETHLEQRLLSSFEREIVLPFGQNFAILTIASPETLVLMELSTHLIQVRNLLRLFLNLPQF